MVLEGVKPYFYTGALLNLFSAYTARLITPLLITTLMHKNKITASNAPNYLFGITDYMTAASILI